MIRGKELTDERMRIVRDEVDRVLVDLREYGDVKGISTRMVIKEIRRQKRLKNIPDGFLRYALPKIFRERSYSRANPDSKKSCSYTFMGNQSDEHMLNINNEVLCQPTTQ